jgi:hypothetical protein
MNLKPPDWSDSGLKIYLKNLVFLLLFHCIPLCWKGPIGSFVLLARSDPALGSHLLGFGGVSLRTRRLARQDYQILFWCSCKTTPSPSVAECIMWKSSLYVHRDIGVWLDHHWGRFRARQMCGNSIGSDKFEPIRTGSAISSSPRTLDWTIGSVLLSARTLNRTSVRFRKVQVRTMVRNWTWASLHMR